MVQTSDHHVYAFSIPFPLKTSKENTSIQVRPLGYFRMSHDGFLETLPEIHHCLSSLGCFPSHVEQRSSLQKEECFSPCAEEPPWEVRPEHTVFPRASKRIGMVS